MDNRQGPESDKQPNTTQARLYFILAVVFLFVTALVWSVDASFTYLALGGCVFFLFLGFWNRPWKINRPESDQVANSQPSSRSSSATQTSPSRLSIFDLLKEGFEKRYAAARQQSANSSVPPKTEATKKARVILWLVACAIFLFVILPIIFSDPANEQPGDYFQQAEQYYISGMNDSAAANYKRAIREDPTRAEAMLGLGNALFSLQQLDSAIVYYDKALSINPDLDEARFKKGLVCYNQKNYNLAAQTLKSLSDKKPNYDGANQLLGDVYYDQQQYDEAFIWYDKAYVNNPHTFWLCYVLGYLYQTRGNATRAIGLYKEALSYDSSEVDIYKRLGDLLPGSEGDFYRARASKQ